MYAAAPIRKARVVLEQAKVARLNSLRGTAVEHCKEAIKLLKRADYADDKALQQCVPGELALIYAWLVVISREGEVEECVAAFSLGLFACGFSPAVPSDTRPPWTTQLCSGLGSRITSRRARTLPSMRGTPPGSAPHRSPAPF